jgi:hypothetical protein
MVKISRNGFTPRNRGGRTPPGVSTPGTSNEKGAPCRGVRSALVTRVEFRSYLDCDVGPQYCLISRARVSIAKLSETSLSENSSSSFRFSLPAAKFFSWINNSSGNSSAACPLTSSVSAKQNLRIAAIDRLSKLRFLSVAIWPHYITRTIEAFFAKFRSVGSFSLARKNHAKNEAGNLPAISEAEDTRLKLESYSALATSRAANPHVARRWPGSLPTGARWTGQAA